MSVANSLIEPTYPPQTTQAGYTVVSTVGPTITIDQIELVRQRLSKGVWLLTLVFNVVPTASVVPFQFGVGLDGASYNTIRFYETSTTSGQSYNMTTPILVLQPIDVIINASSIGENISLGNGTLVQFTRLS
jgi:hypothetical protein